MDQPSRTFCSNSFKSQAFGIDVQFVLYPKLLLCVQFDLLYQKHLLLPSSVSISQLLTEHKNLTAAAAEEISNRSV
jgi:hypothetical protein